MANESDDDCFIIEIEGIPTATLPISRDAERTKTELPKGNVPNTPEEINISFIDISKSTKTSYRSIKPAKKRGPFKLSCDICFKRFECKSRLEEHGHIHTGETPYQCSHCGVNFAKHSVLLKHMRNYHPTVPLFKCDMCTKSFRWSYDLRNHVRNMHPDQVNYICKICNTELKSLHNLKVHARVHEPKPKKKRKVKCVKTRTNEYADNLVRRTCSVCNKTCKSNFAYIEHMLVHEAGGETRPLTCFSCKEVFKNHINMQSHKCEQLESKKSFICGVCDASYHLETDLEQHIVTHTGSMEYVCSNCKIGFIDKKELEAHMSTFHDEETQGKERTAKFTDWT